MKKLIYIFAAIIFTNFLIAQTPETEPNDGCFQGGTKSIINNGSFTGSIGTDDWDVWLIQYGVSGTLTLTVDSYTAADIEKIVILQSNDFPCGSATESDTWRPDDSPITVNLNSDYYTTLNIYGPSNPAVLPKVATSSYTFTISGGALPVELTSFTAILIEEEIKISWETATELNNYGFDIERQKLENGQKNSEWKKIGFVEGHGNSSSPKNYQFRDSELLNPGNYAYRLKQIDIDGQFEYSATVEIDLRSLPPKSFILNQNYPNPFNPTTIISFQLPQESFVDLKIYDALGQEIETLVHDIIDKGFHEIEFTAKDLASGIFIYKLKASERESGSITFAASHKMFLVK